ncbi:chaperonin CPN60-like protein 2, mitochondrial [Tanacetum coccineum]
MVVLKIASLALLVCEVGESGGDIFGWRISRLISHAFNVATISANGEREIGELIARAMEKVGKDGDRNTLDNELEVVEGMKLGQGYISPYFAGIRASVDFYSRQKDFSSLVRILELAVEKRRPLLIVAEDLESELLVMLIINKCQAGLKLSPFENCSFCMFRVLDWFEMLMLSADLLLSVIESLLSVAYPESMESLCVQFWDPNSFVDGPVRCLLYNLEGIVPKIYHVSLDKEEQET